MEHQKDFRKYLNIASLIIIALTASPVESRIYLSKDLIAGLNHTLEGYTSATAKKLYSINVDKKLERLSSYFLTKKAGDRYVTYYYYYTYHFIQESIKVELNNFYSIDCRNTFCYIGTDSKISLIKLFEYWSQRYGKSYSHGTILIPSAGKIFITKILSKAENDKFILAVAKAGKGVYSVDTQYSTTIPYKVRNFKPEEEDEEALPIDLLEYHFTDYSIVTYNHKFMEIFQPNTMTNRIAKYTGGGLLTYLELEKSLIVSVHKDGVYKGKILTLETGEVKATMTFYSNVKVVGLVSYRFSPIFVTLNVRGTQATITIHHYDQGTGVKQIFEDKGFTFNENIYSQYFRKRNLLLKNEYVDRFYYAVSGNHYKVPNATTIMYDVNTRELGESNWLNSNCESGNYAFSSDCSVCKYGSKQVGELCFSGSILYKNPQ